jgi:hypothetical protein
MIALLAVLLACPTPLPPGPLDVTHLVNNTTIIVSRIDQENGTIYGTTPDKNEPVSVRVCRDAKINGRPSLRNVQARDFVLTRELRDSSQQFVAIELDVNVQAFYARVRSAASNHIELQPLTEQLQPAKEQSWPAYLGLFPTAASFDASTRVTSEEGGVNKPVPSAALASLRPGRLVKVYGHKSPSSATVEAFLIEIYDPQR